MKQILFLILILVSFTFAQKRTMLETGNSSTTVLDSAATFTGEIRNALKLGNWTSMSVAAYNNHASGVNGTLTIRQSADGTNWAVSSAYTIATDTDYNYQVLLKYRYFQVLFVNGAEVQTEFRLETIMYEEDVSISGILETTGIANPIGNSTLGYATNTISTVEVLGGDVDCKKITVVNFSTGTVLYIGSDNSVTASNGIPLNYLDSYTLTVSNLNLVWGISSGSTDVRYSYEN